MLRRAGAWSLRVILAVAALVLVVALLTRQPGDPALYPPPANESAIEIAVVSHGYHTGLALPRAAVLGEAGAQGRPALINVATRFGAYRWIEIGWATRISIARCRRSAHSASAWRCGRCSGPATARCCMSSAFLTSPKRRSRRPRSCGCASRKEAFGACLPR